MPPPVFDPRDVRPFLTDRLRERLLAKMQFLPSGCVHWTGAYNIDGRLTGRKFRQRRPVIYLGQAAGYGKSGVIVYVGPLILAMKGEGDLQPVDPSGARLFACHTCKPSGDGWYRCVAEDHLRWGTQVENEQDKKQVERLPHGHEEVPADGPGHHT